MLQTKDGVRVEQVGLPLTSPLILPAHRQLAMRQPHAVQRVCRGVTRRHLAGHDIEADATELGGGPGEVGVDQLLGQPDGLEGLCTAIGGHGGDAHLGHDLEHSLAECLDEVPDRLVGAVCGKGPRTNQVLHRLHCQIGVHSRSAEADEERHVVDLTDVAGLDEQPDQGAGLLPDEVVVHSRGEQQRRNRREGTTGVTVGKHDEAHPGGDGQGHLGEDLVKTGLHGDGPAGHVIEALDQVRGKTGQIAVRVDVNDLGQLVIVEHRERQDELASVSRSDGERVALRTDQRAEGCDQLLADGVKGWVGHLGKQLGEVVKKQPRPLGQHRNGAVSAHRAQCLPPRPAHRRQENPQFFLGVAERLLTTGDRRCRVHNVLPLGQRAQVDQAGMQPVLVRFLSGK